MKYISFVFSGKERYGSGSGFEVQHYVVEESQGKSNRSSKEGDSFSGQKKKGVISLFGFKFKIRSRPRLVVAIPILRVFSKDFLCQVYVSPTFLPGSAEYSDGFRGSSCLWLMGISSFMIFRA